MRQLDYSAGVLPVTHVDRDVDMCGRFKPRNAIEAGQYKMYDSSAMHGLPVGVQIAGRRLQEEKVLEGMKLIESLLKVEEETNASNGIYSASTGGDVESASLRWSKDVGVTAFLLKFGEGLGTCQFSSFYF